MFTKTDAIILHLTRFKDNSDILHLYTRDYGRVNFIIYGIGGKKSTLSKAVLAPLNMIEIEAHFDKNDNIQRINKQSVNLIYAPHNTTILQDTQRLFIAETLFKILIHPLADGNLYDLLEQQVRTLENADADWHLRLMVKLMLSLGIIPLLDLPPTRLNMLTGEMSRFTPDNIDHFDTEETFCLQQIANDDKLSLSRTQRQTLLRKLCRYYEIHIDGFTTPRSLDILQEVFD